MDEQLQHLKFAVALVRLWRKELANPPTHLRIATLPWACAREGGRASQQQRHNTAAAAAGQRSIVQATVMPHSPNLPHEVGEQAVAQGRRRLLLAARHAAR